MKNHILDLLIYFMIGMICLWQSVLSTAQEYETPGAMIEIAVNIYEFRLNTEKQMGIFYEVNANREEDGTLEGALGDSEIFLQGTENVFDDPIPAFDITGNFAKLDFGSIDFNLKAAIRDGRATIISNPSITTADGERAQLISGEEVPLTVIKVQGNKTKLDTETRPTGIKLIVTPRIFAREYVLMDLEIESSEIARFEVFDRGDQQRFELPVVTKRNIKTVVIVPSEQQIYIGGLYTNNTGDFLRKVPIAGDLPGLGFFLRGFSKRKNQTETVFQITPTIKAPGQGLATDDTIFENLLQPDNGNGLLQEDQLLDQQNSISPIQDIGINNKASEDISNVTDELSLPSGRINATRNATQTIENQNKPNENSKTKSKETTPFRFEGSKPGR